MFFNLKSLIASVFVAGSTTPIPLLIKNGFLFFNDHSFWKIIGTNKDFLLFTCKGGGNHYELSLAFKEEGTSWQNLQTRLYLKGWDSRNRRNLSWEEKTESTRENRWKLQVFKNSGRIRLEALGGSEPGADSDRGGECDSNKLTITKPRPDYNFSIGDWEDKVSLIQFDFPDCDLNLKNLPRKKCSIQIHQDVGLQWSPELQEQLTRK